MIATRVRTLHVVAVLLLSLLAVPPVVLSNQEVRILGVIVSIDNRQETFLIREMGSTVQGRTWSVRVTSGTVGRRPEDRVATGAAPTPPMPPPSSPQFADGRARRQSWGSVGRSPTRQRQNASSPTNHACSCCIARSNAAQASVRAAS